MDAASIADVVGVAGVDASAGSATFARVAIADRGEARSPGWTRGRLDAGGAARAREAERAGFPRGATPGDGARGARDPEAGKVEAAMARRGAREGLREDPGYSNLASARRWARGGCQADALSWHPTGRHAWASRRAPAGGLSSPAPRFFSFEGESLVARAQFDARAVRTRRPGLVSLTSCASPRVAPTMPPKRKASAAPAIAGLVALARRRMRTTTPPPPPTPTPTPRPPDPPRPRADPAPRLLPRLVRPPRDRAAPLARRARRRRARRRPPAPLGLRRERPRARRRRPLRIPRAWCVSPRHASITSVLPRRALDDLDDAALILTVMYERALGAASPWAPYFAVLPSGGQPLPFRGTRTDSERSLAGTDAYRRVREDEPTMREDHARIVAVCCEHAKRLRAFFPDGRVPPEMLERRTCSGGDEEEASEEEEEEHAPYAGPAGYLAFREAASLVASRAFQLDADGGQGLVPMADMFDHASVDSAPRQVRRRRRQRRRGGGG